MITINIALPTYLQRVLHCGAHRLLYQHMFRLVHRSGRPSQSDTKHLNTGGVVKRQKVECVWTVC